MISNISKRKYANNTLCFVEHYDNLTISEGSFSGMVSDKQNDHLVNDMEYIF